MPRILSMAQIMAKKYTHLEGLPERFTASFGQLSAPFSAIIWGDSGQGKTNLLMVWMEVLAAYGSLLYLSLEEGHEKTMQGTIIRHFENKQDLARNIKVANHEENYTALCERLRRKRSARFIIIDSLQYWNITYADYKALKEQFPTKSFLFISHAKGKQPLGSTAQAIKYDAGLKIRVDGYIAFPVSRFGGNQPYVIWEQGAKAKWGRAAFKKHTTPLKVK